MFFFISEIKFPYLTSNDGTEVTTETPAADSSDDNAYKTKYAYTLSESGDVVITSTVNGYLGFFEVVFDN